MKRVRYSVATSLDGFIAGPRGEYDWIVIDPEIDFKAIVGQFDTVLLGRLSFEAMSAQGDAGPLFGLDTYVFSNTLEPSDYPGVTVVGDKALDTVRQLRQGGGKDIWLFGGGNLFRSLLDAGLVDSVEVAVIPMLLGGGIPLFPPPAPSAKLRLTDHHLYEQTGTLALEYAVDN